LEAICNNAPNVGYTMDANQEKVQPVGYDQNEAIMTPTPLLSLLSVCVCTFI
jgi:hypothetical protein